MQTVARITIDPRTAFGASINMHRNAKAHQLGRDDRDKHEYDEAMLYSVHRPAYAKGWHERDREILGDFCASELFK